MISIVLLQIINSDTPLLGIVRKFGCKTTEVLNFAIRIVVAYYTKCLHHLQCDLFLTFCLAFGAQITVGLFEGTCNASCN